MDVRTFFRAAAMIRQVSSFINQVGRVPEGPNVAFGLQPELPQPCP
jgi:hypothetical protein